MLTPIESFFVRLLRGTVVFTAFVSFAITILALFYAGYGQFAPEPTANLSSRVSQIRQATDPTNLIKELFPADASVTKEVVAKVDNVTYSLRNPSDGEIFNEFNKFLDVLLGGSFDNQKQFSDWLYGSNQIGFSWSGFIDNKDVRNEDNVNILWRSLLIDFAKRLSARAVLLADAKKKNLFPDAFDRLTAPTGRSQAPYFLVWYFNTLQNELQKVSGELVAERNERAALRLTVPVALYVAAAAFGYFICIMFLFLIVSIEASLRRIAEAGGSPIKIEESPQHRLDLVDRV